MKVTVNGISMNYTLDGPASAPAVALSHSLAANLSLWDAQVSALAHRYRVLRYDIRGHGGSDAPEGAYPLAQLASDAHALLGALGIRRACFVGVSLGGMIGQLLALEHPEVLAGLVLCDTTSRVPPEARALWDERIAEVRERGLEAQVEATVGRWLTADFRERYPDVVERVRGVIRATNPDGYIGCCHAIREVDLTDRLAGIAVPTLVLVGDEDLSTPVAASQAIHERIDGSTLITLPRAAHLSNVEQPEAFNRALVAFLAKVEKTGASSA
ncbi:MAG: 3-oxoadipate enol-lactonase [Deltaproteobacteria bacterium]|nr:3-oxoadipate enol-lactonase [Deltaproteobacteria bacterium]